MSNLQVVIFEMMQRSFIAWLILICLAQESGIRRRPGPRGFCQMSRLIKSQALHDIVRHVLSSILLQIILLNHSLSL